MVSISHGGENTEKLQQILSEARRIFGLYGFERTPMKKIASGVFMSKSSLYYYFPDKESLFKGVIEAEQEEFFSQMNNRLKKRSTVELMLNEFVAVRHEHFKRFINLDIFRFDDFYKIKPHVQETFLRFREREIKIIELILLKGKNSGNYICKDPAATAALFLEVLQGLRMVVMQHRDYQELKQEDYDRIEEKHLSFLVLFTKGLKK
ncbi:MAG: TetR/AcrR family transcriptional regulator [Bacteroidetes bacterium]|nr:TetR/AcrR family transcriptional regulator [Bacteroidota bacterium]